jgi:predicted 3-demethylubiquinone-9 3-methyltransferase (glyoxalase superfamily)
MSAFEDFPRITPFLWLDSNAEEAVEFYTSVFKNSRRPGEVRPTGEMGGPRDGALTIAIELDAQKFTAINSGPAFRSTDVRKAEPRPRRF